MSMRRIVLVIVLLLPFLAAGVVFAVPAWRIPALGWLRGEPFAEGKPLSYWVQLAKNGDENERRTAVLRLASFKEDAKPALVEALYDRDREVRVLAAYSLLRLDPENPEAIPVLSGAVEDTEVSQEQRAEACRALRGTGHKGLAALVKLLKTRNEAVRFVAAEELREAGPDAKSFTPQLIAALKDGSPGVRARVAAVLGQIGPDAHKAVPDLADLLQNKDELSSVRDSAAEALGQLGPAARPVLHALLVRAFEEVLDIRQPEKKPAFDAVKRLGVSRKDVTEALAKALADERVVVVVGKHAFPLRAVRVLKQLGNEAVNGAVAAFASALSNREKRIRDVALACLEEFGPQAAAAVPALVELFTDKEGYLTWEVEVVYKEPQLAKLAPSVFRTLGKIGPASVHAVEEALAHKDPTVRRHAVSALRQLGSPAERILVEALKHPDEVVRGRAAVALPMPVEPAERRQRVADLALALKDPDWPYRRLAAIELRLFGEEAVPAAVALGKAADDKEQQVRKEAMLALEMIGPKAKTALQEVLTNKDRKLRLSAAETLVKLGQTDRPVLDVFIEALTDKEEQVRWDVASKLGQFGPAARPAVPALLKGLQNDTDKVRMSIASTLHELAPHLQGAEAESAVAGLQGALNQGDARTAQLSAWALTRYGAAGKAALEKTFADRQAKGRLPAALQLTRLSRPDPDTDLVNVLAEGLKDTNEGLRIAAAYQLGRLGPVAKPAVKALAQAASDDSLPGEKLALTAYESLLQLGLNAKDAAPVLQAALKLTRGVTRVRVAEVLIKIDPKPEALLPVLREELGQKQGGWRREAARLLGQLGPAARPAAAELTAALKDQDEEVRVAAAEALWRIEGSAAPVLPVLQEALQSKDRTVRVRAVQALSLLGPQARPVVLELRILLSDPDRLTRVSVAEALWRIEGKLDLLPQLVLQDTIANPNAAHQAAWDRALVVLEQLGPLAAPAAVELVEVARKYPYLRARVFPVLGAIGPGAGAEAVKLLTAALDDVETEVRETAAAALRRIDPKAKVPGP